MKLKTNYGMVVSGHKEATKAGMKILKAGGNAIAAAIINTTAGKIDMGIVSPNVETI